MTSESTLQEAHRLVNGDRARTHGDAARVMDRASRVADALLYGIPVPVDGKSWEADLRMVCVKLARAVENPANRDNYVDAAGYIELAYQARPE